MISISRVMGVVPLSLSDMTTWHHTSPLMSPLAGTPAYHRRPRIASHDYHIPYPNLWILVVVVVLLRLLPVVVTVLVVREASHGRKSRELWFL